MKIFNSYFWSHLHRAAACTALCAAVHTSGNGILHLEWECADSEWNIFDIETWLLVVVRVLVLVREIRAAAIHMNSTTFETWSARVPW